jgi:hypothetical protein
MGVDLLNRDSIRRNALRPTAISKNFWDILERLVKGNRSCVRISHTAQCIAPYYSLFQSVANGIFLFRTNALRYSSLRHKKYIRTVGTISVA